jgi:hypothetical protein
MAGVTARIHCDNCGHDYLLAFSATAPGDVDNSLRTVCLTLMIS